MKKITTFIMCLVMLLVFTACSADKSNSANDVSVNNKNTSETDFLRNGVWYIDDVKERGPARGEGRYFDYMRFLDDETYETTWLIYSGKDTAQYEVFDNVENVIVFYDERPSDNLNGELWHNDLVCKADLDAGVIYSFGRITRIYRNGAWEYTTYDNNGKETAYSDKSEAIKAVLSENQSKKVYLRKQTDKLKNELQSNIWTIQNYTTEASYDEEYLSGALYFSNDGTCFYWNSPEIKNSFNYEINGNTLSLSNGETYTIIENAEDDSHCLAASNGCAYMAEQNYSISEL